MLVSLTTMRDWLGIDESDTQHDALLTRLEARVRTMIERATGFYYGSEAVVTEVFDGGHRVLWLGDHPKAGSLTLNLRSGPQGEFEAIDADNYEAEGRRVAYIGGAGNTGLWAAFSEVTGRGLTRSGRGSRWPGGYRELQAVYTRGYAVDAGPGDVEGLILDLIACKFRSRGREGIKSETGVSKSLVYSSDDLDSCGWEKRIAPLRKRSHL